MDPQNPIFIEALERKINELRDNTELNPEMYKAGWRYKDNAYIIEGIQGAIIAKNDPNIKGPILPQTHGLDFDISQVLSGAYDELINYILDEFARRDFLAENSLDLH